MSAPLRTRDPQRKQKILASAADLVARQGYHAASMADIGSAAGVTGSAIYRHFGSKSAVLVALFDRVIDRLRRDQRRILRRTTDPATALAQLVDIQVDFVMSNRELARVYIREINNLPDADRRRLRRKQRLYVEEWVALLLVESHMSDDAARSTVHAAIGAIQSALLYTSGLPDSELRQVLRRAGAAVLDSLERAPLREGCTGTVNGREGMRSPRRRAPA
ncbi:MAG TPA: TetR/AcrR family transcriptional regulator [Jatrophihabitantaceae bacterium]|nr:TetR/AcrR family transcriptional regulator [Jatrophihabitantaceae bacterium]